MITALYTNSDRILSVLGLTSEDLDDTFFQSRDLARSLSVELFTWVPTHASVYKADNVSVTDAERYQSDCLIMFCDYFGALKILEGVLGILEKETDGQNEYKRFSNLDIPYLTQKLTAEMARYKGLLEQAITPTTTATVQFFTVSAPTYDPVTG